VTSMTVGKRWFPRVHRLAMNLSLGIGPSYPGGEQPQLDALMFDTRIAWANSFYR